jgi:hypothetical protein
MDVVNNTQAQLKVVDIVKIVVYYQSNNEAPVLGADAIAKEV